MTGKTRISMILCGFLSLMVKAQEMHLGDMAGNTEVFRIDIQNAEQINSRNDDYSPIYFGDGLIFVASRFKGSTVKDKNTNQYPYDLYYAPFDEKGMPGKPALFSNNISSPLHHIGSATLNPSQDLIYFTKNKNAIDAPASQDKSRSRRRNRGDNVMLLYEASKGPADWISIKHVDFLPDTFTVVHPALSPDNSRLYFASDLPGGFGGMDLYYVERYAGGWSAPVNLGPLVNTSGNELFPFVATNGDLYFASNGHKGLGGLDIFVTRQSGNKWTTPTNVGAPINTRQDDFGICLAPNGLEGFFSSKRAGGKGGDDIYRFRVELRDNLPYVQSQVVFIDTLTRRRLEGVEVRMYEMLPNGSLSASCPYYTYLDEHGNISFNKKERAKPDTPTHISDINGTATPQLFKQKQYLLVADKKGYQTFFAQLDGITKEYRVNMSPVPEEDCVEISAFVFNEDNKKPVQGALIILVNRQSGERGEQETRQDGSFNLCLMRTQNYEISIQKPGFVSKKEILRVSGLLESELVKKEYTLVPSEALKNAVIEEGATIVLNHIYYDYNSAELRTDATKELDELAVIMKRFPSMEIELISHTDSRGDWLYNQQLSLRRAQSAKKHLVSKGIAANRITPLGYGESQIRNHCLDGVDCTEEEHQYNRRTEVRILKVADQVRLIYENNGGQ